MAALCDAYTLPAQGLPLDQGRILPSGSHGPACDLAGALPVYTKREVSTRLPVRDTHLNVPG